MKHEHILAGLSLALALSPLALAQSNSQLQLPSSVDDYRELKQAQRGGPCERCGVVVGLRSENRQASARRDPANAARQNPASPTAHMVTTPVLASGTIVKDARQAAAPVLVYVLTVRYEDGSFAFLEQSDEPTVLKGDRVRVVEGRVELRND